ncbi:flagellar basal body P-ring formation chaperone FlgA [Legionella cardiaca]|uniref:Flagella basal body P-ring formation protein FlgA n=1 Tax=Legionella cardiaca TaxID=1071983 RepID=A0ABY8AYF3_9GAMM|nr:flagellar basal body P-ring formation chaperone FlgA [Legionella cardiaca]WED44530.1 flagellar basal body P-ring formation chaperone FlgA [Legionella cardiaca]
MIRLIPGFLLFFVSQILFAEESQSLDLLKEKIENYVLTSLATEQNSKIQVTVDRIDSRLKLKPCAENHLEVFNPYSIPMLRATIMGVKCQESVNRWTLYVPIKVTVQKPVLVAKRPLTKGTMITENDLEIMEVDISQLKQGYFDKVEQVINQVSKTNVAQGSAITPLLLQAAVLVHKGEQVAIQAISDSFVVSMEGIALTDGAAGEMIRVKNLSSKKIIEAQVSATRQVKVPL